MSESKQVTMKQLWGTSQLSGASSAYLDSIYESYLEDPNSIDQSWLAYFNSIRNGQHEFSHAKVKSEFKKLAKLPQRTTNKPTSTDSDLSNKHFAVMDILYIYRYMGHKVAKTDPLGLQICESIPELSIEYHNLSADDLMKAFNVGLFSENKAMLLQDIISKLQAIYCDSIGFEYMHMADITEKLWIRQRIERDYQPLGLKRKTWILDRLSAAESLEKYLGMKYVGQKRFSLEGCESLIVALDTIIYKSAKQNIKEMVLGMAHRGRLNVLVNVMGKSPEILFQEFEGSQNKNLLAGDVKYHMGFSSYSKTEYGDVHLSLAFNPSHLEVVGSVVQGSARAREDRRNDTKFDEVIPIQIHGDSAFCGQGIVMETFALSQTRSYSTGGTIHIVINNQVGFTTNKAEDLRSSSYCTDIAKMIEAPVFHVNADDPEAVFKIAKIAIDYRMKFHKDVVIDLVCYRRHGHNEADEPSGTQPEMYNIIKKLPTTRAIYANRLVHKNEVSKDDANVMVKKYRTMLEKGETIANISLDVHSSQDNYLVDWHPFLGKKWTQSYDSKVDKQHLVELADQLNEFPGELKLQPQVAKVVKDRAKMAKGEISVNWGFAEIMAYASLLDEGHNMRLSGEDSGRGTFSHRHAVLHNYDVNSPLREYIPLANINGKVDCKIIDSVLSEYGVLGFEYGYSCSSPETLVIWEAQFGDFANTAQVVIDQFISSAEEKWGRLCGLVMYLPHGQEGMGAEHSSARLERYLQLCANDNMQVCEPTTPAQLYHMLRRQMNRFYRKPLIVMTPKSLLRHPLVISSLDELADGEFHNVIGEAEPDKINPENVNRVIICSGKVYYDLLSRRDAENITNIAILRLEQIYPFPKKELSEILADYKHVNDIIWAQEEPENQGAWWMIQHYIRKILHPTQILGYAGRKTSSAPAVGYPSLFHAQQTKLVEDALNISTAK